MVLIYAMHHDTMRLPAVSVPLRGLWFLSFNEKYYVCSNCGEFPSPYGDYGSYPSCTRNHYRIVFIGFRPLTGIMVLIRQRSYLSAQSADSFRPLTGIMVLIQV